MSDYVQKLIMTVIDYSKAKNWKQAVLEWEVVDCIEDDTCTESCLCGQENLRYLYTIENLDNGKQLFPIGSVCIEKFGRKELNEVTSINRQLFELLHEIEAGKFISLKESAFTRKTLKYLYENGVFKPSSHNNFEPKNDYDFMVKMFNKRNAPTEAQQRKINGHIIRDIKPFLQSMLEKKIVRKG